MIDLSTVAHHHAVEEIVDVLCNKTQNTDRGFFRVEMAYFLGKMAACMRVEIFTKDRGAIPVNIYALALATSGFGKGHSVNIVETEFMKGFKTRFMTETFPTISDANLNKLAAERAVRNGTDEPEEYEKLQGEFRRAGAYPFTFDSATTPAVKQLISKLKLANVGGVNLQIDEIGSNLVANVEVLTLFLELYDQGLVKQKLTKNTAESERAEELDGKTPTNMLLFGTPSRLLDGGQVEDQFYGFLDTGYARRCLFGIGHHDRKAFHSQPVAEIYDRLIQPTNHAAVKKWADRFEKLADPAKHGWKITVDDVVGVELLGYKIECEKMADTLPDHAEIQKAELSHRYFKALKLAGAYAFVDGSTEIELIHLHQAMKLVEESGLAFQSILNREKTYVKLAKYIANCGTEVTHADLHEALPFYKSSQTARNEMMGMAMAWGYKQHIVIKKLFIDGIDFFKGETLKETDVNNLRLSYGEHWAYNFLGDTAPFDQLGVLMTAAQENGEPMHWMNHHFKNGHRSEENVIAGFNTIVLDIDGGVSLEVCHELLKDYKFLTYTTKRHTDTEHRFRLVLPINYYLELDGPDYKEFMNQVMEWLPFATDESANQRSKKWLTHPSAKVHINAEGQLLDVLPFIPKTNKNEQYRQQMKEVQSLDNLERWFAGRIASGNRNNQMIKFALALVDSGYDLMTVNKMVHGFNAKLSNPLQESEVDSTIMVTVAKRYHRA